MSDPSLVRFRVAVHGALAHLESRRQEINDLNVFPVADGDTGDNMALTLKAVVAELDRLAAGDDRSIDEIGRDEIVETVARAALLGARGNSGVILSQLIRGAAEELVSRPGELVDPVLVGAAFARAAQRAYASVREPAEGTILTVMRDMATSIASDLAHLPEDQRRLGADADPVRQNEMIADALERAIVAGEASVQRGPDLLPVLREAGVVDAGGYGVTIVLAGVVAALRGTEAPELEHYAPARITHPEHASETYRYCTNFAITGKDLEAGTFVARLEAIGDSVLVVGDHATLKVHVHTDEPEQATQVFADAGAVSHLDVADMHAQVLEREERLAHVGGTNGHGPAAGGAGRSTVAAVPQQTCGALAVVTGAGLVDLFESMGAHVLDGGPTLNPSTMEILAGIHDIPAEEVVVLPNSPNVFMAAERAAELSDKVVHVIGARSQQAGLAAAVALNADRGAAENAAAMAEALAAIRTAGVAEAAREDHEGRFAVGDAVGYVGEDLVAWGTPTATLTAVLAQLATDAELITCIEGDGAPLDAGAVAALAPDGVELELEDGGQPSWWWLLSAE
ncbi:MAG TPA: DAK2 domain-containing protein [Baekduia sp.]|nr:DAK2 domain-containing protein [Baekduia sp.]